jgi:predicted TIM-barrel fold metal-dependent hydrolase
MNATIQTGPLKVKSPFGGRKVVDIDTHYSEPHDLWTKRAPAKYKSRVPRMGIMDGAASWIIDETHRLGMTGSPSSTVLKDGSKMNGLDYLGLSIADIHPGCFDVKSRVALMDAAGISAQIIYPNVLGFGSLEAAKVDPELRLISTQIYNDAMAEIQEESGQRIFPMALLPWWDVKEAVAEITRTHELGLRGININPEPHEHRAADGKPLPDLGQSYWNPLWEICQSLDLPVNFHIGASNASVQWANTKPWPGSSKTATYIIGSTMIFLDNATMMANLVFSGLLDRFPKLKFVSVESGLGWVPFVIEALDYQYSEARGKVELQRRPSEYIKQNVYTSFWFERRNLTSSIRAIGVDNVMFETDFPHPTCLYPIDDVAGAFDGLTEAEINKVLNANAVRVYNLPV